jgi:hypothetical protein
MTNSQVYAVTFYRNFMGDSPNRPLNCLVGSWTLEGTRIVWICVFLILEHYCGSSLTPPFPPPSRIARGSQVFFPQRDKKINCSWVMERMISAKPATEWPPPRKIPIPLQDEFTQHGEMPGKATWYLAQRFAGTSAFTAVWETEQMANLIAQHKKGKRMGGYGLYEENSLKAASHKYSIKGKDGAVIGSASPWVEAILFASGASNITTIEYGTIVSHVPNHRTFTPPDFGTIYLTNAIQFDFVASISSLEHSGLGRYGDSLNPRGDIDASEEVYCMLKPGGLFFIGLPYARHSELVWNAHRIYGPERMALFAAGYKQLDYFGRPWQGQGVFVLQKPGG